MICSDSEIGYSTTQHGTSRRHCSLTCIDGRFVVEDVQSTHGTYVNGELIREPRALVNGDVIAAGQVEFRYALG
jgi:pSer/pThr/pTyr-binding forkhead associated (FHA) protein